MALYGLALKLNSEMALFCETPSFVFLDRAFTNLIEHGYRSEIDITVTKDRRIMTSAEYDTEKINSGFRF